MLTRGHLLVLRGQTSPSRKHKNVRLSSHPLNKTWFIGFHVKRVYPKKG
jgi:hypothetical protein